MARQSKSVSVEPEIQPEKQMPDFESIMQKAIAEAVAKARMEWESGQTKQEAVEERGDIPDNLKVEVVSNVISKFFLKDSEEHPTVNITFGDYGDKNRLTLAQLQSIKNNKPKILKSGMLAIKRVVSENKQFTINDVYEELILTDLYNANGHLTPLNIEDLFSDKVTFAEFSAKINERIEMYDVVLEIAYEKYRKGQFNDNAKMSFFRQMSNNQNLFK